MMASFSNSTDYYEGNINDLSCLLRPRSLVSSSESDSLKSIKSSATLLRHSSFLDDADSLILGTPPELCGSDSITPTALYMPFLPHANGVQNSLPNLTMPEASFHAFESAPDESKNTVNLLINDSELLDGPPIATSPFYTAFKPTVDRGLLEPQHLPDLDGYVQVQSHSNFTTLPVSDSPQKSQVLIPTDHISRLSPPAHSFNGPPPDPRSSLSSPDSFFTAPASLESSSDASFETALTTIEPVLSFHNPNDTSSVNILAAHLHPTPNGNIDQRSPTTREVPDSIPLGDVDPSLLQPHRIISHSKTDTVDTQSPQKSASFYLHHPDAQNPSLPKGPVHDGSLLSPGIHVIVSEAAALYEATQENRSSSPPGSSSNPFSLYSPEALECQYAITVDAKNALTLRQSAVIADIGLYLDLLIPKVNIYAMDEVKLTSIYRDLDYIHQECISRHIDIQFTDLEWQRSADHPCGLAFIDDKRHQEFSWRRKTLEIEEEYSDAQAVGIHFVNDPTALIENRLPALRSQR